MNKSEILEHYNSSLNKWEEILNLVKNDKAPQEGSFWLEYWNPCGFCKVHDCGDCPLDGDECKYGCSDMGKLLRCLDLLTVQKEQAVSKIQDFIKLIEKIIKERKQHDVL